MKSIRCGKHLDFLLSHRPLAVVRDERVPETPDLGPGGGYSLT